MITNNLYGEEAKQNSERHPETQMAT
jgi:hypothetical protein